MFVSDCIDEGTVLDADTNGEVFCTLPMFNIWLFVIFEGTELEFSGLAIEFRVDTAKTTYCQVFTN